MTLAQELVFGAVIVGRFLIPLLIIRYPLPAIIAALVLDGVDQTIFQTMGYDPPGYQGYDKAMDVYYLAIAYLATMRNWTSMGAYNIARFLYFYRLVGVVAYELSQWRALLLVFANTFEYFFIAYETVRLRWDPRRFDVRFWAVVAGAIWIFVKLPQEYWIHVAQLDVTDALSAHPVLGAVVLLLIAAIALTAAWLIVPRLGEPSWPWRIVSDPVPEQVDEAAERSAWIAANGRVLSVATAEKVVLVGLISVIYGQVLPGLKASPTQVFVGVAIFVVVNAVLVLVLARACRTVEGLVVSFLVRVLVNVGLVLIDQALLSRSGGRLPLGATLFFVLLLSLVTAMYDRYLPVHAVRRTLADEPPPQPLEANAPPVV